MTRPRFTFLALPALAALFLLAAAPPLPAATDPHSDDPAIAADLAILRQLDKPFPDAKIFRDADAGAVVALVREATGLAIEIDRDVVGDSGGWEYASVNCDALTPRIALDAVARAISTSYREMVLEVVAGIAIFTDNDRASRITAVRRYALSPILLRLDASDPNPAGRPRKIASMLTEAIDRDGWRENGGEISWLDVVGDTLVISTTPSRHHRIENFLDGIARSLPTPTLRWSVTIAEIEPSVTEADLARVLDSAAELDALVALGGAHVKARPSLLVRRHDEARMEVAVDDEGGVGRALSVTVKPVFGLASFSVHVEERDGNNVRSVTLRAIEGLRCAGVIDVNGARLLVAALAEPVVPAPTPSTGLGDTGARKNGGKEDGALDGRAVEVVPKN